MAGVRRGAFTCVGWQVTLCDPIWQVTLRSCVDGVPNPMKSYIGLPFTIFYLFYPCAVFLTRPIVLYR